MKKIFILILCASLILAAGETRTNADAASLEGNEQISGGTYLAEKEDESVFDVSGNTEATITGAILKKISGDASSANDASFKGVNSAVRVSENAVLYLKDCEIEAKAKNATGVFAYGSGKVCLEDCVINVTGGGAGGIQVAGGGVLSGQNLTVTSASKAAIRSDRGGGTIELDGGTYTSTGTNGCPAVYSTADITIRNAECISERSRAVIIEGKNTVTMENCVLSGNDQSSKEGSIRANVLLYQSASGDADYGTSIFSMKNSSMICLSGAAFYCTNTNSIINLESVSLSLSESGDLLIVSSGRWGKEGSNGGKCTFNVQNQILAGSIRVDEISSLSLNLADTDYRGAINSTGTGGSVSVSLDEASTWTLTEDSYISEFNGSTSLIETNGFHLYVGGECLL